MAFNPQELGNKIKTEATNAASQVSKGAIEDSVQGFLGSAVNFGKTFASNLANDLESTVDQLLEPFNFASKLRGQNLPKEDAPAKVAASAEFSSDTQADWRVRLSVPNTMSGSDLLKPLVTTQNSLTFPLTPSVIISHSANYNSLQPVHTNYPFQVYENSSTDDMTITGEFPVENDQDGRYWVACMHYLRSVTKMNYGTDGSPPPVVRLNGYGDYIFKNVPVVISNFTVDLPVEVDYIAVSLNAKSEGENDMGIPTTYNSSGTTWVPTLSQITVTCKPTYSRRQVSQFDLNQFVNGNYVLDGRGFI